MSKFAFIVATMLAVSPVSALAQDKMIVDMKKMTCAQLTKLGFQDFAGVTMWLSGYYNASVRNTVVDLAEYARAASKVKTFCQTNPRATVMAAANARSASRCRGRHKRQSALQTLGAARRLQKFPPAPLQSDIASLPELSLNARARDSTL